VTAKPDITNKAVFNKGYSITLIISIPIGGQISPKTIEGLSAEWKKAQKKPKKSIISEAMNNKNPLFKPMRTTKV
jgi:hypothetical protein